MLQLHKPANDELCNWGRAINDGWLNDHLLWAPPPTSEGYVAPVVAYDDPEPVREVVDEILAQFTTDIVAHMGLHNFEHFQVLQYWYTILLLRSGSERGKLRAMAKQMHCSAHGAERMLVAAVSRYWDYRQTSRERMRA